MQDAEKQKEFQIFVNTKPRKVPGPRISFEQVLAEAGINTAGQDLNLYDVVPLPPRAMIRIPATRSAPTWCAGPCVPGTNRGASASSSTAPVGTADVTDHSSCERAIPG